MDNKQLGANVEESDGLAQRHVYQAIPANYRIHTTRNAFPVLVVERLVLLHTLHLQLWLHLPKLRRPLTPRPLLHQVTPALRAQLVV